MAELATLFVRLRSDSTGFKREAESQVAGVARELKKVAVVSLGIAGGFGVAKFFHDSIAGAKEAEVAQTQLALAIHNVGAQATVAGHPVQSLIEELGRASGIDPHVLEAGFGRLVRATGDSTKALRDERLAADVSRGSGRDLLAVTLALTKAEQGQFTALNRLGIVVHPVTTAVDALTKARQDALAAGVKFSAADKVAFERALDTARAQDAQATKTRALAVAQERFGGAAARFAQTTEGASQKAAIAIHLLEVSVGEELTKGLTRAELGVAKYAERLQKSGELQDAVASGAHSVGDGLHVIAGAASTVGPPLLAVAHAAEQVVSAVGAGPILAGAAAYKGLSIATGLAATAQEFYNRQLLIGAGFAAKDVAALDAVTAAELAQTAASEGAASSGAAFRAAAGGLVSPLGIAAVAVTGLAVAVHFLDNRETESKRATEGLADALTHLSEKADAHNLAGFRVALNRIGEDIQRIGFLSASQKLDLFAKPLREQANAAREANPLLAHNLNLIADLARATGQIPTEKEIRIIINNKQTRTSLAQIASEIAQLGGREAADADVIGNLINEGVVKGLTKPKGTTIANALTGTLIRSFDGADAIAGRDAETLGRSLMSQVARQLADKRETVAALKTSLAQTIAEGEQQIRDSIISAKQNLSTIGQGIGDEIGQLIDAGPLGQRIATLQAQLNASQTGDQKGQLKRGLRDAKQALDDANKQLVVVGPATPAQRKAIDEFLRPFREKVRDAQKALKEFDTQGVINQLQRTADKEKETVTRGLADLISQYNHGAVDITTFNTKLAGLLEGAHVNYQKAGQKLGQAFVTGFQEELQALKDQVTALVGLTTTPNTKTSTSVVKPRQTIEDVRTQIAQDTKALQKAQNDLTSETNRLLRQLLAKQPLTAAEAAVARKRGSGSVPGATPAPIP